MDERILVEVYVPAVGRCMEIVLPAQVELRILHVYVSRLLEQVWDLEEHSLAFCCWYLKQQDSMPDFGLCVKDAGICNGERIILL